MDERRGLALIFVLTYVVGVLALILARFVVALEPASQTLVALVAGGAVGLVASRRLDSRRLLRRSHTGRSAVAVRVVLLLGLVAVLLIHELLAEESRPIFTVGLVLPVFLSLLFAIEAATAARGRRERMILLGPSLGRHSGRRSGVGAAGVLGFPR